MGLIPVSSRDITDRGDTLVVIEERRRGTIEDNHGFVHPTHNAEAWWGWEVDCDEDGDCWATGRIVAYASNNASGGTYYNGAPIIGLALPDGSFLSNC